MPPALGHSILLIERDFGVDLFVRIRNSQILIRIWAIKNAPTAASDSHLPLFLNHLAAKEATR